jgi:hypothetical protein
LAEHLRELTKPAGGPALARTTRGGRSKSDGPPTVEVELLDGSSTFVCELGRDIRHPIGIGRIEADHVEKAIGVVNLVALAIHHTRSGH